MGTLFAIGEYEPWRKWNPECEKELSQPPYSNYNFYEVVQNEYKHDLKQLEPLIDKLHNLPYNKLVEVESRNHKKVKYRIAHAWHEHRDDVSKWSKIEANLYVRKYAIGNRDNPDKVGEEGFEATLERMVQEKRVRYDKVVEDRHRINILKRLGERIGKVSCGMVCMAPEIC